MADILVPGDDVTLIGWGTQVSIIECFARVGGGIVLGNRLGINYVMNKINKNHSKKIDIF